MSTDETREAFWRRRAPELQETFEDLLRQLRGGCQVPDDWRVRPIPVVAIDPAGELKIPGFQASVDTAFLTRLPEAAGNN